MPDPRTDDSHPPATRAPSVTIGMPVYNGARFMRAAVESLLAQTHGDFELLISDNASTDDSRAIAEEFARTDARVRYIRHERNLGAVRNWNFVAEEARGEFFKWASANDLCAPQMLERCVAAMRADPHVVLCYGRTLLIDDDGSEIQVYEDDPTIMDSSPSRRFARILEELAMNNAQSGLIRTSALRRTRLEPAYPAGDLVLMAELALLGGYLRVPDVLLHRRVGRKSFTKHLSSQQLQVFIAANAKRQFLPSWRRYVGYATAAARAPVALGEKLLAWRCLVRHLYWDRRTLWGEFAAAVRG